MHSMLKLNNITLVCVDCLNYIESVKSIHKSIEDIEFGKAILFTDRIFKDKFDIIPIEKITSKKEYSKFIIKELYKYIETDFVLIIQYDGYIINPDLWNDKFLDYDYIGAPWWYSVNNVGNGGFSLRSKKLLNTVKDLKIYHPEDDVICRGNRQLLESKGIKFAPEDIAKQFSYEPNNKREPFTNHTFGFHGLGNLILR